MTYYVRQQFTGYERDNETELDFAQSRMYGGGHGRFSTPDPYNVILEKERGEDEDERADILIGFISNPQRWNMYVYVVNNPLAFTDPDGQKPRTINVFLDAGTFKNSPEGLEEWKKWAASAQEKDTELTVIIYLISKDTPGTINAFLDSLKAKDTATIFMGHSSSRDGERLGISFATGDIGNSAARLTNTADGVNIRNDIMAVFSCGFGKGFGNITSSNGTAFVSIIQGQGPGTEPTSGADAINQSAFQFAKSIATGSWSPALLHSELDTAKRQSQAGFDAFRRHPNGASVNAGDYVDYRILPPPRKK